MNSTLLVNLAGLLIAGLGVIALSLWQKQRYQLDRIRRLDWERESERQIALAIKLQCDALKFENEWMTLVADEAPTPKRYLQLIRENCSEPTCLVGWIVEGTAGISSLDDSLACPLPASILALGDRSATLTRSLHPNHFECLRAEITTLHLFRCQSEASASTVLVLSQIPRFGSPEEDRHRMERLASHIHYVTPQIPEPILPETPHFEIDLAREMLEIRSLLDIEFQSPREMMEGFLDKLAVLAGYEVATLFLLDTTDNATSQEAGNQFMSFASSNACCDSRVRESWNQGERHFVESFGTLITSPLLLTNEIILECELTVPFRCGMMIPVHCDDELIGLLMLTHRDVTVPGTTESQLIHWASSFLIRTLKKEIARAETAEQARRDPLTKLANRRTFDAELRRRIEQSRLRQEPCSLILLDLDHFKSINDRFGHTVGDLVLQQAGSVLIGIVQSLRCNDQALAARYGGEEFAVILPNVTIDGAARIAEQIRESVAKQRIETECGLLTYTASLGVATLHETWRSPTDFVSLADVALYEAKKSGRNCVQRASNRSECAQNICASR